MRTIAYLLLTIFILWSPMLAAAPPQAGVDARGVIESAEITGADDAQISGDIRDAVQKLVGQRFDQKIADDLVTRIQDDLPDFIATTRLLPGGQADRVKVVFSLEKRNEEPGGEANINSRYTVERVEVQGFDASKLDPAIRDDMQKLVGEKLDQDKANQILRRIEAALRPRHTVMRKVVKGSDRQHIVVIYEVKGVRWIPFLEVPTQRIVYHSKQNFSAVVSAPIGLGKSTRLFGSLVDDQDQLLERFAGFNVGFETVKAGTDHLGLALRYARYHERWQPSTVAAGTNSVYRERTSFDPSITFAFDPRVRVTAGVSLSDLEIQYPEIHQNRANAVTGSFNFHNVWGDPGSDQHSLRTAYDLRAGNHQFDSDFIYTRHFANTQYEFVHGNSALYLSVLGGTISGNAPLFERFSLGDTSTLRGWNKFDIAPLGGDRVVHATLQYGFDNSGEVSLRINENHKTEFHVGFYAFYDVGAVGDHGSPMKAHHSVGVGFGPTNNSNFFIGLGFPIRSSHVVPAFMMGFRF